MKKFLILTLTLVLLLVLAGCGGKNIAGSGTEADPYRIGTVSHAAGIVAYTNSPIINCSNSGTISSDADTAGIACNAGGGLSGCTNTGTLSGDTDGPALRVHETCGTYMSDLK